MTWRRWISFGAFSLAISQAASLAVAQPAPAGAPTATRSSDTGYAGAVNASGGYGASVPLDMPAARGGLPIPVEIAYGEHGVGAAGLGWDVPLSYIRRDTTVARRRPVGTAGVAPLAREQVSLVLEGQRMDLVRTATGWVARGDAPDLRARENSDGTWSLFDGNGRTYHFTVVAPALAGANLWLLQDVSGLGGSNVHLDYDITTPTVAGGAALSIDLIGASYNPHPTTSGCYKNSISLIYDSNAATPLSVATLGDKILARQHKLTTVDIVGKEDCTSQGVRLRRYEFAYLEDPDTKQQRLQSVQVSGRAGTPEGYTPITIAKYKYGTATKNGLLAYDRITVMGLEGDLGHTVSEPSQVPAFGNAGVSTTRMLIDVSGDGRPDLVSLDNHLTVARNTESDGAIVFGPTTRLEDTVIGAPSPEMRTSRDILAGNNPSAMVKQDMVWRQVIDVNGDGRIDVIDAAAQPGHWVVYLNTPDETDPAKVHWQRRSFSIAALIQQLQSRGYTVDANLLPLARRTTLRTSVSAVECWQYNGVEWVQVEPGGTCHGYQDGIRDKTITEWEMKDVNGDGYPDVVFNSSPVVCPASSRSLH